MQVIRINAQVEWASRRGPSGALVAVCDPLGISLQADDEYELNSLINEAIQELFTDLLEDGEFEQFLSDRGWDLPPAQQLAGPVRFDMPYRLVSNHAP